MINDSEILKRATDIMPGGVSSPVRSLKSVSGHPLFLKKAKGAKIWDIEDNEYYDLCMSFGPLILGHAHPEIVEVIKEAAEKGTSYGTSSLNEVLLAEKIVEKHPATDWVRFVNSGTEAVMSAIRLARGYTNRRLILKFSGCYHGHADSMLVKAGSGLITFGISSSKGVPSGVSNDTIVIDLGNIEEVKLVFEKYGENIAATIIEGIPANNGLLIQSKNFMKQLEETTHKYGSLFILDEVITGFRIGWGGATAYYDLNPDIVTFGKVIGGGLPVGAYGGKMKLKELISPLGPIYQAGTLSGNPLVMQAGLKSLEIIERENLFSELENIGKKFEDNLIESFNNQGIDLSIRRVGSIVWLIFEKDLSPINPEEISQFAVDKFNSFHKKMYQRGVYLPPSAFEVLFLSLAHKDELDNISTKFENIGEL